MKHSADHAPGLEFPCRIPIKAMGRVDDDFVATVVSIVGRHTGPIDEDQVRTRESSAGRFQSVTVTIHAETREQLETIYGELAGCEQVLWTL